MKIAVSGASGLIGSALLPFLEQGHSVVRLVRSTGEAAAPDVAWNPETGGVNAARMDGVHAVVHLAGESVSERWTEAQKKRIRESRGPATRRLCESLSRLPRPPQTLVSASAIGFYGDGGGATLTESSPSGSGFLAEVCREWEDATRPAENAGIRVVRARIGIVLSAEGGALPKLLPLFRAGLGGKIGSGQQYWSWITLPDTIRAILHALQTGGLQGPVNVVAPNPVPNALFTETLAKVLHRPGALPAPAFALRLLLGQMADEALLAGARVQPAKLLASGFAFEHPQLEGALQSVLAAT